MTFESKFVSGFAVAIVALATVELACSGGSLPGAASSEASGISTGTKMVSITDPNLNMKAYSMTIPANWMFEGVVIQGTPCAVGAFPIFRMFSPDGLVGTKMLPRLDWAWSDSRNYTPKPNAECLPYKKEMSASEVLKYMIGLLKVEYVRDEPTPQLAEIRKNIAARNTPQFTATADIAAARVRYYINKIQMDEVLNVFVGCSSYELAMLGRQHSCSANVTRSWAPQGKYPTDTFKAISKTFTINQEWNAKWNALMAQKIREMAEQGGQMVRQYGDQMAAQRNALHAQWQAGQDMRQRQHEEFMSTLQRGTDMSMQRAQASSNARGQMADDWCDFALDRQKRMDPNTGEITKDSSAYSYTWMNESGKRIQTNDINANPNGNGTGNWTLQENVH